MYTRNACHKIVSWKIEYKVKGGTYNVRNKDLVYYSIMHQCMIVV